MPIIINIKIEKFMTIEATLLEIAKTQEKTLALLEKLHSNGAVENNKIYDLTDLENLLHVSRRTLFKWKSEGKLNFSQIGKKLYVTEVELKKFIEAYGTK